MGRVSNYLNFNGDAEEAFAFYAELFGTQVTEVSYFRDLPEGEGMPQLSAEERKLVLHAELPILDGFVIMATDLVPSMGMKLRKGNNVSINLSVDTNEEADRLYCALAVGDEHAPGMQQAFFGYWGSCEDRFGIRWMVIVPAG